MVTDPAQATMDVRTEQVIYGADALPPREKQLRSTMIRPYHHKLLAIARVADGAVVFSSFWVVLLATHSLWLEKHVILATIAMLLYEFFAEYNELYYAWRGAPIKEEMGRIVKAWILTLVSLAIYLHFSGTVPEFPVAILAAWIVGVPAAIVLLHLIRRVLLRMVRSLKHYARTVAVVGANELSDQLVTTFTGMPWLGYQILGLYDDRFTNPERIYSSRNANTVGNFTDLVAATRRGEIDDVYITLPLRAEERVKALLKKLADTTATVYLVPDLFSFDLLNSRWTSMRGIPVVSVYDTPFRSLDAVLKRLEDIIVSTLVLTIVAIPMAVIAVAIKVSSPGPILFRQTRYGVHGEPIGVLKFRTMTVCEDGDVIKQATRNDPRITPLGAFLRRTSLDELPQFFNVLMGEMSVVGPRPHAASHNEQYRSLVHGYMLRHKVRPGITGLAQVKGFRGETDTLDKMARRVFCDLEYIRDWSLFLDIKIIFLTIFKGFRHEHAY